jgi:streptogramin lyase
MKQRKKHLASAQHFVCVTLIWLSIISVTGSFFASTRLLAHEWEVINLAGTGKAGFQGEGGPAVSAELNNPFGVIRGPDGCIWFCEYSGNLVRRINSDGTLSTIVGDGNKDYRGDGGPARQASLNMPHEIRFGPDRKLYIADMGNHVIRRVDLETDKIDTIAGTGEPGYSGDGGPAVRAQLKQPHSIQFGPDGILYICDIGNHAIRAVDVNTGMITTFAGGKPAGPTLDGTRLIDATFHGPRSIDFDKQGDMWLATREGNQVFRIAIKEQRVWHIAGTGEKGFAGHGGNAKLAKLSGPKGIAIDSQGGVWLADTESHSVRRIREDGAGIDLVAGTGDAGDGPSGEALRCRLNRLHGIYVDNDDSILIGDSESHRIRELRRKK